MLAARRLLSGAALRQAAKAERAVVAVSARALGLRARTLASDAAAAATAEAAPSSTAAEETHAFQAHTREVLDLVANALYTHRDIAVRELVSNASDSLEKARHLAATGQLPPGAAELPLTISLTTDEAAGTLTIADSGVGMSREELMSFLGTIAKSGTKEFAKKLRDAGSAGDAAGVIGKFGVGFYSAFMLASRVEVTSTSATAAPGAPSWRWTSSGDGSYSLAPVARDDAGAAAGSAAAPPVRGTRVVLHLKDGAREFSVPATVKDVLGRYSSFLAYPILLNGKQVNTVGALWAVSKGDVTEAQYDEFYKHKSGDFERPLYRLHFSADAPIALNALLFVGSSHEEKMGMGRMAPGVDLYCRKVLIEAGARGIIPDWLRFVVGVVDSEDLPLNVSRETLQDSALVRRLRSTLTRRLLRFFEGEARRDAAKYNSAFFSEFGNFLKEGAVTDASYAADIAKLLRFESSALPPGQLTSFDEYVSRMPPGQSAIYYLMAPHRGVAEASPYMEAFRGKRAAGAPSDEAAPGDVEVLFLYSPIDDFVMNNLREFNGRKLTTAESAEVDPATLQGAPAGDAASKPAADAAAERAAVEGGADAAIATKLTDAQVTELGAWMVSSLPKRLGRVKPTTRLSSSPAVVTDHESAAVRRMMRLVEQTAGRDAEALRTDAHALPKQNLEVNPSHPVIVGLHAAMTASPQLALLAAEQVVDNALVAAGLVEDARTMLPRLNALLESVLTGGSTYRGEAELLARRHVPPKEADERAAIAEGEAFMAGLGATLKEQGLPSAGKGETKASASAT